MSYISYYNFIEAIRKWDVKIVKVLIDKVKQLKIPFSTHTYPTLDMIIEALYGHFSISGKRKDFAAAYWQSLPDEAYQILELLRPFYDIRNQDIPAHKHYLYEPVMRGDLRMIKYLRQVHPWGHIHSEINKILYLGILDFCYMRLPSWEGLPECKDKDCISKAYIIDIHSPDLIKILYKQAERCNVPIPEHLDFLIKHGAEIPTDAENIILYDCYPQLEIHISHDRDYGTEERSWRIHDAAVNHKYHCAEELVKSCIANGEYWSLTCECGIPECANIHKPVVAMRFGDTARWRITASDDDVKPNVYYISVPVKPYLQDMDTILKTIESGIKSDAVLQGDPFVHDKIDTIPSTDEGLKKVRQIRAIIRKEFRQYKRL